MNNIKKLLLTTFLILAVQMTIQGQPESMPSLTSLGLTTNDSIYWVADVDKPPEFPGGVDSLFMFMRDSFRYPETGGCYDGRVSVGFVINKDGTVSDAKILRGIHPLVDKEALRVVNSLPRWKPGKHKGRTVRVLYAIPFKVKL